MIPIVNVITFEPHRDTAETYPNDIETEMRVMSVSFAESSCDRESERPGPVRDKSSHQIGFWFRLVGKGRRNPLLYGVTLILCIQI